MLPTSSKARAQRGPTVRDYLAPNVDSAEEQKPWVRGKENSMFKVTELFTGLDGVTGRSWVVQV